MEHSKTGVGVNPRGGGALWPEGEEEGVEGVEEEEESLHPVRLPRASSFPFWFLGLFNNSLGVVVMASATTIHAGGVGVVFLCNNLPAVLVKATGPFWMHLVHYPTRVALVAAGNIAGLLLLALGRPLGSALGGGAGEVFPLASALTGVALASAAGGLGEPTFLSYTARFAQEEQQDEIKDEQDKDGGAAEALALWASGTGFAGVLG